MLLIFLIWCYQGIAFFNSGFALRKLLRVNDEDPSLPIIFGMFFLTLASSFWAVFGRIHYEFQICHIVLQLVVYLRYRKELIGKYRALYDEFKDWELPLKIFLFTGSFLTLFSASSTVNLIDNETYYIQTIKWLNSFGFVPGLANLHIFFGQTSGWHILQSAFSFPYLTNGGNDLNGFCLVFGLAFSLNQIRHYFVNRHYLYLWSGIVVVPLLLLTPITAAPSPDFAVILFSLLLFYYFIKYEQNRTPSALVVLTLTAVFIVYIKISALPVLLLPAYYLIRYFRENRNTLFASMIICSISFFLFAVKNTIISGYPLFPSSLLSNPLQSDFALPETLHHFWWNPAKQYDFFLSPEEFNRYSVVEIIVQWFTNSRVNSMVGFLLLVFIILIPVASRKSAHQKAYMVIYLTMLVQILYLVFTTPQYRFVLSFVFFFLLLVGSAILIQKRMVLLLFSVVLFMNAILVFSPLSFGLNYHRVAFKSDPAGFSQLICPAPNSNLNTQYSPRRSANLNYFSPDSKSYLWVTGDGDLPCVNSRQIDYFEQELGIVPQPRGKSPAQGFCSKKIQKP